MTKVPKQMGDEKRIVKKINALLIIPLALLLLPGAYATRPSSGSGTFTATNGAPTARSAGGNMIITHSVMFTITGAIAGTCKGQERDVVHADGTLEFHGMCTFTGSAGEKSGTTIDRYNGKGTMASFEGRFVVGQGTGGLDGLHGVGAFEASANGEGTSTGTYTLQWHIDPK